MEIIQNELGLSNFVNKEMLSLCRDNDFTMKSEQILSKLSWMSESVENEQMEAYSHESMYSFEYEPQDEFKSEYSFELNESLHDDVFSHISLDKEVQKPEMKKPESSLGENSRAMNLNISSHTQDSCEERVEIKEDNADITPSLKRKCMAPRDVKPANFTSLKRKDVIFKSILRMMRRFFCNLLESNTEYNRKEKCIFTKHKQLVKCIFEGIKKIGFNEVGPNMPFYFAAFAYPNDMKKILKESKQQFRIQNDLLCQASFTVRQIDNAFNRFSKKVFDEVLAIPQIAFLIKYYLENCDELVKDPKIFETCYEILREKSQDYKSKTSRHAEFDLSMDGMFEDFNLHTNFLSKNCKA
jgi:hypothetical protein